MIYFDLGKEEIILELYKENRKVNWRRLSSAYIKFPIEFIRKYKDKIQWSSLSCDITEWKFGSSNNGIDCANIEDFIREFEDYIDWSCLNNSYISLKFSNEFIEEFTKKGKLNWDNVCKYQHLSEDFIRKHKNEVNWSCICSYQKHISEDFIREMEKYVDFYYISCRKQMSNEFIEEFKDKLNWNQVTYHTKLSEDIIEKYSNYITWDWKLAQQQTLSEEFMEKYADKLNWSTLSLCQKMSEPFIRKFKNRVNWNNICRSQHLSEDFIEEFKKYIDWECISHKTLSEKFIRKHVDKLDLNYILIHNKQLSEDFIRKYYKKMNTYFISGYCNLSESFIEEFKDKLDWDSLINSNNKISLSDEFIIKMKKYITVDQLQVTSFHKLSKALESDRFNMIVNKKIGYKYLKLGLGEYPGNKIAATFYHYFQDRKLSIKQMVDEFIERGINEKAEGNNRLDILFIKDVYDIVEKKIGNKLPAVIEEDEYVPENNKKVYLLCLQRALDNGEMVIDEILGAFSTEEKAYKTKKEKFDKSFDMFVKVVEILE